MSVEFNGLLGFLILIADIYAIVNVVRSGTSPGKTVGWILLILILPVLGWVVWYFAGPRARSA